MRPEFGQHVLDVRTNRFGRDAHGEGHLPGTFSADDPGDDLLLSRRELFQRAPGIRPRRTTTTDPQQFGAEYSPTCRDDIQRGIEELGVDQDEHITLVIEALADRADDLGIGPREDAGPDS